MFFASFRVWQYFWFFRQRLTSFNDYIFIVKSSKESVNVKRKARSWLASITYKYRHLHRATNLNGVSSTHIFTRQRGHRRRHPPFIGKRDIASVTNDDVVKHLHTENVTGFLQACRQRPVFFTGLGITARMIVQKNHGRRRLADGFIEHFPRMHQSCSSNSLRRRSFPG